MFKLAERIFNVLFKFPFLINRMIFILTLKYGLCGAQLSHTHLIKLLARGVCGASIQCSTWGVRECNIAHRRSVAVLCMLFKIWFTTMHPLYDAQHVRLHCV